MTSADARAVILGLTLHASALGAADAQQFSAPSFVFARFATGSASVLYATRGFGKAGGFVGLVVNPKSQYRELIAGGYTRMTWSEQSVLLAVAYADTKGGRYLQTYVNPSLSHGPLAFSATIEWYEPLERLALRQLSINPASLEVRATHHLAVGLVSTLDMAPGVSAQRRLGGVAEWSVKWGSLRLEVLHRQSGERTEARVAVLSVF